MITTIFFWGIISYGITTIIVYGSIFEKPRTFMSTHSTFLGTFINCPLCVSTWVGFFLSLTLGGLTNEIFHTNKIISVFFDGMFSAGFVWALNSIIEFFEENRIK